MGLVHEHDLVLVRQKGDKHGGYRCTGCRKEKPGQVFFLCSLCKTYFHETCAKLPLEIKHFFHPCPLFLHTSRSFSCNSCFGRGDSVLNYKCEQCEFEMCPECAAQALSLDARNGKLEGEQKFHSCHRHPLQPLPLEPYSLLSCRVCDMPCSLGGGEPTWGCVRCNFHLHESCLLLLPETVQERSRTKLSSSSLVLITVASKICSGCNQTILSNLVFHRAGWRTSEYLCISCCLLRRLIGESSSEVSKFINHFFHPCLGLKLILSPFSTCNACFISHQHFSYHCKSCDFFLCFYCAQLPQLLSHEKEANQLVQHFCHWHPLKLFRGTQDIIHKCSFCGSSCSEPFYTCNGGQCQFYIHKSCMDSLQINHHLQNQTLVLLTVPSFKCTTCSMQRSGLTFYSSDHKCKLCVQCVLKADNVRGNDGRLSTARHWHQLILQEQGMEGKKQTCFLCKEPCIGWTWSYKCSGCDLVFHKSCAELPTELDHPFDPEHRLILTKRSSLDPNPDMCCQVCLKNLSRNFLLVDWVYQCQDCHFQLDTLCATSLLSLEYKRHPHLLYVVVNMYSNINCQACSKSCKGSCTIRCADQECDFSLHLQCGPLPHMVKHARHVHPLILKEYYVEDNDSDKFACHICEEERDPRLQVYCCSQGCLMIADVKCVLDEVLQLLRGEHGEVKLRTPFPQVACTVINNKSVFAVMRLDSLIVGARDKEEVTKHAFSHEKLLSSLRGQLRIEGEKEDEAREDIDVESYPFTWKALSCFVKLLHIPSFNILALPLVQQYNGSTMEGDYALPKILGQIYQEFFAKYNIIDHKCNLNFVEKRALIFITCCVLHQMRITKVVDVTKDTILVWLGTIRFVQEKGRFNVGFVAENIKHVWQAHYYIQSRKIVEEKSLRLEQELEQVSMYEAELRTKMDELRIKMEEAEARYQALKKMDKEHDTYRVVGSRGPMKKARSNALAIKWRTCYDSLVTYPGNAPAM